jgi:flagellar hook-associated protein 3 FlgL
MRISTNSIYEAGTARLNDLQAALDKTMRQISTGRRVLTPADDPIASARALDVSQSQSVNSQFSVNRRNAESALSLVESTLAGATEVLQDAKTLIVNAGNGSFTNADRKSIALELRSRFDQMLGLANTADGSGNYLFSGYAIGTAPFVKSATGATYQGDQGQRLLQVDASRRMAISDNGQSIFQSKGQDVFRTFASVIEALEKPVSTPAERTALNVALGEANKGVDQSLENVLSVRASAGSRLREIESLENVGSAKDLNYQQTLSELQDLDYNFAVSQLTKQQTILQAAQKTFSSVSELSLFNYI